MGGCQSSNTSAPAPESSPLVASEKSPTERLNPPDVPVVTVTDPRLSEKYSESDKTPLITPSGDADEDPRETQTVEEEGNKDETKNLINRYPYHEMSPAEIKIEEGSSTGD